MKKGEKTMAKALAKRTERKSAQKGAASCGQTKGEWRTIRQARQVPSGRLLGAERVARSGVGGGSGSPTPTERVAGLRQLPGGPLLPRGEERLRPCGRHAFNILPRLPELLSGETPTPIAPAVAHELIYGSLEYAAGYGFRPDPDFALAQMVLDLPEAYPPTGAVTFGKDGKPFYVSGPRDNVTAIMNTLMRTAGPGNFDYLAHLDSPPDGLVAAFEDVDALRIITERLTPPQRSLPGATLPKPARATSGALLRTPACSPHFPCAPTPRNISTSPPWSNGFGTPRVKSGVRPTRRSSRTSSCRWSSSSACPMSSITSSPRMPK